MSNVFPGSLNNYVTGSSSVSLLRAGHTAEHNALEEKIGVDSSDVVTSLDYLLKSTSSSNPGHKHTLANGANDVTATAAEVNKLAGLATTKVELGYVSGVTSAIQTQLDAKVPKTTTVNGHALSGNVSVTTTDLSLNNVDNTSDATKNALFNPPGTIIMYGGAAAATGYLLCDGASYVRTDYAALFAVIGTTYGNADGTHFNVPDFRGIFPKGAGTTSRTLGKDASGNFYAGTLGTYLTDKLQGHKHDVEIWFGAGATNTKIAARDSNASSTTTQSAALSLTDDGTNGTPRIGHTTEPQSLGITFIIKT